MTTQQPTPQARPARAARLSPARINAWVDLALGGLLAGTVVSAYLDTSTHILFGAATMAGVTVHLALHWRWVTATIGRLRKISAPARRSLLLVLLLLLVFIPLLLSGAIVALIYAPQVSSFHTQSFYLFIGLVLTHLALKWRWIAARLRR